MSGQFLMSVDRACGSTAKSALVLVEWAAWRGPRIHFREKVPVLHAEARLVRDGRQRLKIPASWPWAEPITVAWQRIDALPQSP